MPWSKTGTLTPGRVTRFRNIASRSNSNSNPEVGLEGLPTVQNAFYRTTRRVLGGASGVDQVKLVLGNFYTRQWERGEQPGPNAITVRASIEYPAGAWRRVSNSFAYAASEAYVVGDQVTYNGNAYVCTRDTTAGTVPTNQAYWTQVQRVQVTWPEQGANNTVTVPGGETDANVPAPVVYSDPVTLPVPLQPGQKMAINLAVGTGSSTGKVCPGDVLLPVGDLYLPYGASPPSPGSADDVVTQWPTTQTPGGTTWVTPMVMPVAVLGATSKPCTYLLGDSIVDGHQDVGVLGDTNSWGPRALDGYLWEKSGRAGGWAAFVWRDSDGVTELTNYLYRLDDIAARCEIAITAFGTNEIADSTTTLQSFKDMQFVLWRRLAAKGCRVWQTTITPQTTSTDGWATTTGQSKPTDGGFSGTTTLYSQVQAWLAAGAPYVINGITVAAGQSGHPLAGVLDLATAVIDPATGWKWKAAHTNDGVHPNGTGYDAMAAQLRSLLPQVEADFTMSR